MIFQSGHEYIYIYILYTHYINLYIYICLYYILKIPCVYHVFAFNIPWIYNLVIVTIPIDISLVFYIYIIKNVVYYTFNISWRIPFHWPWTYHYTSNIPFIYGSRTVCKVCIFWDSRFTIQDCGNLVWIQALTDMGPWMTVKAWIQEVSPRILNLGSRKVCKVCNFLGSVCVCVCLYVFATFCWFNAYACVYVYVFLYIYNIYIYGHPFQLTARLSSHTIRY